jgi:hypothetical protein
MPVNGLLGIEDLTREEIQAILDRARDFQPRVDPRVAQAGSAARPDGGEPVLRSVHAHAHQF